MARRFKEKRAVSEAEKKKENPMKTTRASIWTTIMKAEPENGLRIESSAWE